jgi:hypothetical protein
MTISILMVGVGALVVSAAAAVLIGKAITQADRIECAQRWDVWCTGCGLPAFDRRAAVAAIVTPPGWSHDDENYCPACTETRFHTWGYSS